MAAGSRSVRHSPRKTSAPDSVARATCPSVLCFRRSRDYNAPMCGFAGEFILADGRADLGVARRMAERLVHRGPDEDGAFLSDDGRCAIGFRRLQVIDPPGSQQPMTLPDRSLTVAFNGEIYNYRQLRNELTADGAAFRTVGDTEVLLHLYRRHGTDTVARLEGMFSFVLYDRQAGALFLARDRLGQKPLWYAPLPDRIVFASEAKGLLCHPNVRRHTDLHQLPFYATLGYVPAPRSMWRGVAKLPPATRLLVSDCVGEPETYWAPCVDQIEPASRYLTEEVRETLSKAVEARMLSDVPLGALLSGGVDSSIVVALMSQAAGSAGGVRTFTAGFDDPVYDERAAARQVAQHCRTDHTELLIRPAPAEMLDLIIDMYDEPFADSSALPTFLICQAAREHVTVALAGDGGDEVFAGYDRYRALHLAQSMSPLAYTAVRFGAWLARPFAPVHERNRLRRLLRFADVLEYPSSVQYLKIRSIFDPDDLSRLFTEDFAASHDLRPPTEWFCELYERPELLAEAARAQRHDLMTYLPDDLLVKADRASMASSLELRAPMLDHRLVDLGLSLPTELKICGGRGKAILREAFGPLLPAGVFRRPKLGFGVPLGRWLREDLREILCETLLDPGLEARGIFRSESVAGLINDHIAGRDDHSHRLWSLLVFARWLARQG